jgi:hypothetical protein
MSTLVVEREGASGLSCKFTAVDSAGMGYGKRWKQACVWAGARSGSGFTDGAKIDSLHKLGSSAESVGEA